MITNLNPHLSCVTLKHLNQFYPLSVLTFNTCTKNGLTDLNKIISFYLHYKSFDRLRLVGIRTNQELLTFCHYFLDSPTMYDSFIAQEMYLSIQFASLSAFQKEIINYQIQLEIKALRASIYQVMMNCLNKDCRFDNFANIFIHRKVNFSYHRNMGVQSIQIVADLIQKIERIALEYAAMPDKALNAPHFRTILTNIFPIEPKDEAAFLSMMENKNFPLFNFLNYLLENEKFVDSRNLYVIKCHLDCFETEKLSLVAIGENLGISRERARQLSASVEKIMKQLFIFLSAYKHSIQYFTNYEFNLNENCIEITQKVVDKLNQAEKTHFSKKFISKCFSLLWEQTHILFDYDFKNTYLIQTTIFEAFLFEAFFDKVKEYQKVYQEEPTSETICYPFTDFATPFMKKTSLDLLTAIQSVCKKIIANEFSEGVAFDFENNIIFKLNIKINDTEKVVIILSENNAPMKVHEIQAAFNERYPDAEKSINVIRTVLYNNKTFIYFGRSSTYGLIVWEETQDTLKGGTIRDIAETYLNQFEEPKHISEIAAYVLKYRPKSNCHKMNTNLVAESESTQRFRLFKGHFWGLSSKKYENMDFNKVPPFFLKRIKELLSISIDTEYEAILAQLCSKYRLKRIQVQFFLEKYIEEGILRRENNFLTIAA